MDFTGKKVLVIGLARSGMAAIKVLHKLGADIVLSERKPAEELKELATLKELGVTTRSSPRSNWPSRSRSHSITSPLPVRTERPPRLPSSTRS